jgi:rubrerythrin
MPTTRTRVSGYLKRRRRTYRCKACATEYAREKPYCPACKTRKRERGDAGGNGPWLPV